MVHRPSRVDGLAYPRQHTGSLERPRRLRAPRDSFQAGGGRVGVQVQSQVTQPRHDLIRRRPRLDHRPGDQPARRQELPVQLQTLLRPFPLLVDLPAGQEPRPKVHVFALQEVTERQEPTGARRLVRVVVPEPGQVRRQVLEVGDHLPQRQVVVEADQLLPVLTHLSGLTDRRDERL